MTRLQAIRLNVVGAWLLAVIVPWLALHLAGSYGALSVRRTLSPFGWDRLIVAHIAATLPLCMIVAVQMQRRSRRQRLWSLAALVAVGFTAAWMTTAVGRSVGPLLDAADVGMTGRLLVRFIWCATLQLPWCLLAASLRFPSMVNEEGADRIPRRGAILSMGLALLAAVALPAAYTASLIHRQTAAAGEMFARQQVVRAIPIVTALCDVGSQNSLANQPPSTCLRQSKQLIAQLEERLSQQLVSPADKTLLVERAAMLAILDRSNEAIDLIKPLFDSDAQAALLLAAIHQQQGDWQPSTIAYRRALQLLDTSSTHEPERATVRVRAYDGIAFNARELRRYQEAESAYLDGLRSVPTAQAHFHFQLGRHYQLAGRPLNAAEHLRAAAQLDPENYSAGAAATLRKLDLETPGCVLRSTWPSPARPLSR